jgi:hypothetical protein
VASVKEFMGERLELFSDEMTLFPSQSHPYPLPDTMLLSRLLIEHRHLILLIHEGKEICYGVNTENKTDEDEDEDNSSEVWWGQPMPDRYIGQENSRIIFDFRYLSYNYVSRIRSWMYQERNVYEIWLLGTHPHLMDILYSIAEDILCLVELRSIIIHNPMNSSYIIPYKSSNLHKEGPITLKREGLCYLYQHLLLDQYRPSAEDVEIWIDGGLLPGVNIKSRFFP